ncbi:hypothetical protein Tco_0853031, partial [Tanacetum coccineum]
GASCTQREVSMVFFGRISPNSFLSSILLLVLLLLVFPLSSNFLLWSFIPFLATGVLFVPVFLLGLLALTIDAACAFRVEEMPSLISCRMAAKVMAGVSDVDVLLGGILSTKDNTGYDKDGDNDANGGNDDEREIISTIFESMPLRGATTQLPEKNGTDNQEKDEKKSQNDKTGLGMEML